MQPVYLSNNANITFVSNITSFESGDNVSCNTEYCELCVFGKNSSKGVLQIINNNTKTEKSYPFHINFTGSMFDYYIFFFEYSSSNRSNNITETFGKGNLVYSYSYSMLNNVECFIFIVFLIILVYLIIHFVKNMQNKHPNKVDSSAIKKLSKSDKKLKYNKRQKKDK